MEYWAFVRWFCEHAGIMYVFEAGKKYYEDPYCYTVTFFVKERFKEPLPNGKIGLIEAIGIDKVMNHNQLKAIVKESHNQGFGILATRVKNNRTFTTELCKKWWDKK